MKKLISYGSITFALAMLFATTSVAGPAPVNLGTAADFVILSQSGITDVPSSVITGNIGTSPITGAKIGVTCAEVTGTIFSVDPAGPLPCRVTNATLLTTAVHDMQTAYTNAAGRPHGVGPNLNLDAGSVHTQTLAAGTYTWGTPVTITGDLILNGGATDVWIFQVAGTFNLADNVSVSLTGGALPANVFWQVSGAVTLGTNSDFVGTILAKTNIAMNTGADLIGRALAQTAVTLQMNGVTGLETQTNPKAPNWGKLLSPAACGAHLGKPIIDVQERVINDVDSGLNYTYWAIDNYTRHIQVWSTGSGMFCALVTYNGTANAVAGQPSPGGVGVIGLGGVTAKMNGGYIATFSGTLLTSPWWKTHGSVGTVDYQCNIGGSCFNLVDWVTQYFVADPPDFTQPFWGWFYDAGKHGTWLNMIGLTTGNIN